MKPGTKRLDAEAWQYGTAATDRAPLRTTGAFYGTTTSKPPVTDGGADQPDDLHVCAGCKAGWDAEAVDDRRDEFSAYTCPACDDQPEGRR